MDVNDATVVWLLVQLRASVDVPTSASVVAS
jgi:hypothetical protein